MTRLAFSFSDLCAATGKTVSSTFVFLQATPSHNRVISRRLRKKGIAYHLPSLLRCRYDLQCLSRNIGGNT
ncbi:hypothetical protein LX32DRAFT_2314 [Colletotrichum zoysiae]|uniref:Uncharacterized protein n=1 Tax=Colletotrichum zoysiae TaxID=1216348 RepID=A0AAD9M9Q2_9PEZI|nr:hypothetical protein LX32DRAFT_2314 [Colletotrichum zoysiae]